MDITERLKEIILQETDTDINIRTRKKNTVEIRSLYCNILKELKPNKTLQSIGDTLELNHASIIHSLRMYEVYSKDNTDLKKLRDIIMSHFIKVDETEIELLNEVDQLKHRVYQLTFDKDKIEIELRKQKQIKRYDFEIIENLNNLLEETKETMQYDIINDRLKAFYTMNKNIRL